MKESDNHRGGNGKFAVVSKMYCSTSSEVTLTVRKRPHVVNGGGFVVTESDLGGIDKVVFRVDGCGVLGMSGKLIVRDGDGDPLLCIRREKGGCLEAIGVHKKWTGYSSLDYQKPVFTVKEANNNPSSCSCLSSRKNCIIRIWTEERNLEIRGCFPDRNCLLVDSFGKPFAKVCTKKDEVTRYKDVYHVMVAAGIDRAFICGIIAILDHIHGESTSC
ncbi:hypothetical protein MLD38_040874 [Melastoma candidum]|nr:hypothetical protein MLD38_040874 [Melastoma candidum]